MRKNCTLISPHHSKYFVSKIVPPDPEKLDNKVDSVLKSLQDVGFQGRKLGEAYKVWTQMLNDRTTIFLGIAGALIPAGMRKLILFLIQKRYVDVVVSTGAQLFHDLYESFGEPHWKGSPEMDDNDLRAERVDRVYDCLLSENILMQCEKFIVNFIPSLDLSRRYSTRQFLSHLGKFVSEKHKANDSILATAYRSKVPVYCPSIADSEIGIAICDAKHKFDWELKLDVIKDILETGEIVRRSKETGAIFLSGGVPRNFIQQAALIPYPDYGEYTHKYAIVITTDAPHWGGLSGSTVDEAKSWGKYRQDAVQTQLFCDVTVVLPFLVTAIAKNGKRRKRKPKPDLSVDNWMGTRGLLQNYSR